MHDSYHPDSFNHKDFHLNPRKYKLFRSAIIAEPLDIAPELKEGTRVNIKMFGIRLNKRRYQQAAPIYEIWVHPEKVYFVYAWALKSFSAQDAM